MGIGFFCMHVLTSLADAWTPCIAHMRFRCCSENQFKIRIYAKHRSNCPQGLCYPSPALYEGDLSRKGRGGSAIEAMEKQCRGTHEPTPRSFPSSASPGLGALSCTRHFRNRAESPKNRHAPAQQHSIVPEPRESAAERPGRHSHAERGNERWRQST